MARHQNYLVAHAVPGNPVFDRMTNSMGQLLSSKNAMYPGRQAYARVAGLITGQATTLAYMDVISVLALVVIGLAPFVLIMRKPGRGAPAVAAH
ncbi:MAG TPA: hypothetical protein VKV17_05105, partial [Bryobacteraceae bacterium]|nr:hypothetical protein [Bryobacteraceae bacterium]